MDQNQQVDDDLQKAIDNITNTTSTDPVFSDPVAAPSSIPEDDTGELSEPVGPFPEEPKVQMIPPAPEPIAPLQSTDIPELSSMPPITTDQNIPPATTVQSTPLNTSEVKKAALRDLVPLIDHLDIDSIQKFNLYRDIFEDLRDYTVLEPAYNIARTIPNETERAKALLYLVESIDKM